MRKVCFYGNPVPVPCEALNKHRGRLHRTGNAGIPFFEHNVNFFNGREIFYEHQGFTIL